MIRAIGAGCIVVSTTLLGERAAQKEKRDLITAEALLRALAVLEAEIAYLASDLEEAFVRAAKAAPAVSGLFRRAARSLRQGVVAREAWVAACVDWGTAWQLPPRQMEILQGLAAAWGPWRAEDHVRHLRLARDLLQEERKRLNERLHNACRLWRYLGISSGLLLVLLLY